MNTGQKSPDRRHLPTGAATSDEPDGPFPPRYWWLKRILAGVGLLLVGLLLLRLVWGWEANRRLQAEIDSYIAAGEPIHPEDFDPAEDIPNDQNAAKFLMDAAAAVTLTPDQVELISKAMDDVEAVRADADALTALVEANAQALSLVRKARDVSGVDWGFRLRRPVINTMLPSVGPQRALAKLTCAAAVSHGLRRNESDTLEALHDALAQSHAISEAPALIHYLVGAACRDLAIGILEDLAPTLVHTDGIADVRTRVRTSTRALALSLLDEDRFRSSFVQALLAERCVGFDFAQCILDGSMGFSRFGGPVPALWSTPPSLRLAAPLLMSDAVTLMNNSTAAVRASRQPNWPQAEPLLPPEQANRGKSDLWFHPLDLLFRLDWLHIVREHFRSLARSRMAALALAIRLYEFDHDRRPGALAELVPEYFDAVPLDPFTLNDELRYLVKDDGAILYSVGFDGNDNHGAAPRRANEVIDRSQGDIVFYLDARPRQNGTAPADPSPETGNDEGDDERQEADPGKDNRAEKSP